MHNLSDYFTYSTTSPTYLINKVQRSPRAKEGEPAGAFHAKGLQLNFKGKMWQIARVVWELHNGSIPDGMVIIFKDRNSFNCSIENLMLVTRRQKGVNCNWAPGKSGYVGVTKTDGGKFISHITIGGSTTHLGVFSSPKQAISARKVAIKATKGFVRGLS